MPIPALPIEVIDNILAYFIEQSPKASHDPINSVNQPYLEPPLVSELLTFRLIDKNWANAVLPHVYDGVRVSSRFMISSLSRTLKDSFLIATMPRLSRLSFERLEYPILHISSYQIGDLANRTNEPCLSFQNWKVDYSSTLMKDIEGIITMCSDTLTDVRFRFNGSVGFSPGIIKAVERAQDLQILSIIGGFCGVPINDSDSIKDLLNAAPGLRSLYLQVPFLRRLSPPPGSLPQLEHLSVTCNPNNLTALRHLIEMIGENIKAFEYVPHDDRDHSVILAMRSSLRILFTDSLPDCLPVGVRDVDFPHLRLIRTIDSSIFITDYDRSHDYWRQVLRNYPGHSLMTPPRFRHIIFVIDEGARVEDPALAQRFEVYGICCHFTTQPSYWGLLFRVLDVVLWGMKRVVYHQNSTDRHQAHGSYNTSL
ncbi:uncharacterized protein MELLADRAFT_91300 [Melampsora larici-populina 98AG31]|uniref:Uncharacterized protein n=1 Tax=Melampsora larici-populina (strain 98AG31 / pathotype 3-4-7) TaxID=747676 RepID=F4RYJ2_MELLP|nr:uncharacterized protein MELLADRAFT_91300 [Melampsora larici-populina 98AG31]EGG02481.1 hypothetical protein MELLADRAFT_91300 [Melampsora larici-populina 98AG31]